MSQLKIVSPSRRYVAMCNKPNFNGHYFSSFELPEDYGNNAEMASWYFMNVLDAFSRIECCIAEEDFKNVAEKG